MHMDLFNHGFFIMQVLPQGIAYRAAVEQITNYRLKVVQDNDDVRLCYANATDFQ